MNLKKTIKKLAISALLAVAAIPVHGQDLLARQAPVDRKMAAVDTIMLRNITIKEDMESPPRNKTSRNLPYRLTPLLHAYHKPCHHK